MHYAVRYIGNQIRMNHQIQKYVKNRHKEVKGWYSGLALEIISEINRIQSEQNINGALCEIGVHHGRCFVLLSMISRENENCIAIDLFENQNENIKAGIYYALTIQHAILPAADDILKIFPSFIIYMPKDIVSGDFYWFTSKQDKKKQKEIWWTRRRNFN